MATDDTNDTKRTTLRLSRETNRKLAIEAARREMTVTELVEELLGAALKGVR